MTLLAHVAGAEEMTYVFLPAAIIFIVYRLVRGVPRRRRATTARDEPLRGDGVPR